jgi:tetratricopeptide (TPR) repeat protein
MNRMGLGVFAFVIAVMGAGVFSAPARADDRSVCLDQNAALDDGIAACGRLIDAGKSKGNDLAGLYDWRAYRWLKKNNADRALSDLDQAIRLYPKYAHALSLRCWAWHDKGDADKALTDCNQSIQLDPKTSGAYQNRANAYILKSDYDHAISDYSQTLQLQPTSEMAFELRGNAYIGKADYDHAIADLTEAIRLDATHPRAFNWRANAYFGKKNFDLAVADYSAAARLAPTEPVYFRNRGWTFVQMGDTNRALPDYDQALRLNPNSDLWFNERGQIFLGLGNYDRAAADFDSAIRINANNNAAFGNRGLAYFFKGDFDRALADYAESIRLNPKNQADFNNRCLLLSRKGDLDAAMADCDEALRLVPRSPTAFGNRCGARLAKGDPDAAVADCDQAIAIDPGYTGAYVNRGMAYEAKGDKARATADFQTAIAKPPKYLTGKEFQETARQHLAALGGAARPVTPAPTPGPVAQQGGRRVALVIGNSGYKAVAALPNPSRDAAAVAGALRSAGFQTVTLETDLSLDRFINALRLFARQAESADWALIYYAGHGMEMNGTNYLIPIDAKLETDRDVNFEAVPLDQALNAVEGARKLRVVILDACRDNPFANQMRRTTASRSIGRGLARVEPDGGTLVAYAAKGGEVALDGDGQNSPFVSAILKYLPMPGVEINKFFRLVRDDVLTSTGRKQEPFVYGSLPSEDFFFVAK